MNAPLIPPATGTPFGARILPDLSAAEYHADPCARPSLSASIATTLVSRSPLHAWNAHPRLGGVRREPTPAMDAGSLLHALLLGGTELAIIEADDFRTKAAQAERDAAYARGAVPVLARAHDDAQELADCVRDELADLGLGLTGESEVSVEWEEESGAGPVLCRGRMDHVWWDRAAILDLKTCQSAHERAVRSHVWEYGYDVQRAAYCSAMRKLRPEMVGREKFTFVFVETLPPGSRRRAIVQPVELDGPFREIGERRWRRAVDAWGQCLATDLWPAYAAPRTTVTVEAPGWAIAQEGIV